MEENNIPPSSQTVCNCQLKAWKRLISLKQLSLNYYTLQTDASKSQHY
jgi:hypothetical protein